MDIKMYHYVQRNKDGTIHVQNAVMGRLGQHHVHSKKGFEKWKEGVKDDCIEDLEGDCDCGLGVGNVREYDGRVWHNDKFDGDGKER